MGNFLNKQKQKTKDQIAPLEQIIIKTNGDCYICNLKNVYGYQSQSIIKNWNIFVCEDCKNLK